MRLIDYVRLGNDYTSYFEYVVGLRQGVVMSPVFFSLFIEDLELCLQDTINSGIDIEEILALLLGKSPK